MKRLKPKAPSRVAQKSQYRAEYRAIFETLRETRLEAGLTQIDLAERLGRSQNYVSQAELGYKRLDGLQLWDWMHACSSDMEQFGRAVEAGVKVAQQGATEAKPTKPSTKKASKGGARGMPTAASSKGYSPHPKKR
ncbi:helix-turn-helix domain-containing protein [Dyella acidisoli]|uniref:HTH cro/C1-type domain-containing protein n=1 Tax=Dyella acidisoli TaxID=1867834 RepID=A0ABQ5XTD6_9GAMM|nr:helix-turn-helix transcriptional regulator [Dyella acidisoli]GLQ95150.1 hypothetical protein GCM10007901_41050 [Dyella acidisoli]